MKYAYPAIFEKNKNGVYDIEFPDIDGIIATSKTRAECEKIAREALTVWMIEVENQHETMALPSKLNNFKPSPKYSIRMIEADTADYYKYSDHEQPRKRFLFYGGFSGSARYSTMTFVGIKSYKKKQCIEKPTRK